MQQSIRQRSEQAFSESHAEFKAALVSLTAREKTYDEMLAMPLRVPHLPARRPGDRSHMAPGCACKGFNA